MFPLALLCWIVNLGWAMPIWQVAPLILDGPSPQVGAFVAVNEVVEAELFGVLLLSRREQVSHMLFEQWLQKPSARARTPLVVVSRSEVERVLAWLPEGEERRVFVMRDDPLVGLPRSPGVYMMCTPYACVPGAASGTFLRFSVDSDFLLGEDGISLAQARDMLAADPKRPRRVLRKLPKAGRATVEAMPEPKRQEALAIALTLLAGTLQTLKPLVFANALDAECRIRSRDSCYSYAVDMRQRRNTDQAARAMALACERGVPEACREDALVVKAPVARSSSSSSSSSRREAPMAPVTYVAGGTPPAGLHDGFDPAWWPADPLWRTAYRPAKDMPIPKRRVGPVYPAEERTGAVCYALLMVDADGLPIKVHALGCPRRFAEASVNAVEQWRWKRLKERVTTVVRIVFRPPDR